MTLLHIQKQREFYNAVRPLYLDYKANIPYSRYIINVVDKYFSKKNRVLEIGCGQGRFTVELSKHVGKLIASDISKKEISFLRKLIRQLKIKNIYPYTSDIFRLKKRLSFEPFNQIVGFFILHHLPRNKYFELVKNLKIKLTANGKLIFVEPNNLYPFHAVQWMIEKEMDWRVERGLYTNYIGLFKNACKKNGFRQIYSKKFGFWPPFIINKLPGLIMINKIIESIPFINQILCPYILLTFEKNSQ